MFPLSPIRFDIFSFAGNSAPFDHKLLTCLMISHCLSVPHGRHLHGSSLCLSHPRVQRSIFSAIQLQKHILCSTGLGSDAVNRAAHGHRGSGEPGAQHSAMSLWLSSHLQSNLADKVHHFGFREQRFHFSAMVLPRAAGMRVWSYDVFRIQ